MSLTPEISMMSRVPQIASWLYMYLSILIFVLETLPKTCQQFHERQQNSKKKIIQNDVDFY